MTDAAPTVTLPPAVGAGVANLANELTEIATALGWVIDDPCAPDQRLILSENRDRLVALAHNLLNGTTPSAARHLHRIEWRLLQRPSTILPDFTSPDWSARLVCDGAPDAECHVYPDCGHDAPCGCPKSEHEGCAMILSLEDGELVIESYAGPDGAPIHDGPVDFDFDGECYSWCYAEPAAGAS